MKKLLIKLALDFIRNPEEASENIFKIVGIVVGTFLIVSILITGMISSFLNQKDASNSDLINSDYDVESTKMYKDISRVYDKFRNNMIKAMDEREAEIIKENTTYKDVETVDANGKKTIHKEAVCDVTVIKLWNDFSLAYLFAYINHASDVKSNVDYNFSDSEIYNVCKKICALKEEQSGKTYTLYTVVAEPEDAAKILFSNDDEQQMYIVSYDLYDDFLGFTSNTYSSINTDSDPYADESNNSSDTPPPGIKLDGGTVSQKLAALFPDGIPTDESQMAKYLVTVQVEALDKNGNPYKKSLTVHKAIAQDVIDIFKEIKDAGFRAYDIGGYYWRGMAANSSKRSHHSYGVAIDINPNENYMVKNGKTYGGSLWSPSTNIYSFGPDSVVVKAFQKRGWVWGGNWNSSKDYMHFSYTGY